MTHFKILIIIPEEIYKKGVKMIQKYIHEVMSRYDENCKSNEYKNRIFDYYEITNVPSIHINEKFCMKYLCRTIIDKKGIMFSKYNFLWAESENVKNISQWNAEYIKSMMEPVSDKEWNEKVENLIKKSNGDYGIVLDCHR